MILSNLLIKRDSFAIIYRSLAWLDSNNRTFVKLQKKIEYLITIDIDIDTDYNRNCYL